MRVVARVSGLGVWCTVCDSFEFLFFREDSKVGGAVLVKVAKAQKKEGRDEANHDAQHDFVAATAGLDGMGNHVEDGDSQHHATHEADRELHLHVR